MKLFEFGDVAMEGIFGMPVVYISKMASLYFYDGCITAEFGILK